MPISLDFSFLFFKLINLLIIHQKKKNSSRNTTFFIKSRENRENVIEKLPHPNPLLLGEGNNKKL